MGKGKGWSSTLDLVFGLVGVGEPALGDSKLASRLSISWSILEESFQKVAEGSNLR